MKSRKQENEVRPSMWSTVGTAVQTGWGPTLRLLSIIALTGVVLVGVGALTGGVELVGLLRSLVPLK